MGNHPASNYYIAVIKSSPALCHWSLERANLKEEGLTVGGCVSVFVWVVGVAECTPTAL